MVFSVCTYCGVGCDIMAKVENNQIKSFQAIPNGVVSRGKLCVKGTFGHEFINSKNRLTSPKIKKEFIRNSNFPKEIEERFSAELSEYNDIWYNSTLNLAYDITAYKLSTIKQESGAKSIAGIGGARTNCESAYFFQKFIRETIGSPHIDNCARVCHSPSLKGMKTTIGEGASTNPFDDILESEFIIIIGSNTTEAHPIVAHRVTQATQKGIHLAVFDIRDINISKFANHNCVIPYETNLLILNMLAFVIIREGLYNKDFITNRTKGFKEYKEKILNDPFANPNFFLKIRDYEYLADLIPAVAREYATKKSMILWGLGITEHLDGSYAVMALTHLALLSGNIGKVGAGLMPLRGQNNVQGACDMGCLPYFAPDYQTPKEIGLMTPDIIEAVENGKIRAIYNLGEDLAHIHPNQNRVQKALKKLDFLVVNELFMNEITEFANIVFGVKSSYEKRGVYINAERRLHLSNVLVETPMPDDWEVLQNIALKMGEVKNYKSIEEVWDEVREVAKYRFKGATYKLLENNYKEGVQWPVDSRGTERLHLDSFRTDDGLGEFCYKQYELRGMLKDILEQNHSYFYLSTGRVLEHYNNSAQTREVYKLLKRHSEDILYASFFDEDKIFSKRVILKTIYGESAPLRVKFSKGLKKGTLFTTFHHPKSKINFLFGDEADVLVKTARFKSVKVEVINC